MELQSLLEKLIREGVFTREINDPVVSFGPDTSPLLGATILPERQQDTMMIDESEIRYLSDIANDGSYYSPVQLKDTGELYGSFTAKMGSQDIGSQLLGPPYKAILELMRRGNGTVQTAAELSKWLLRTITIPLVHKIELMRWQALIDALVVRSGDNGFTDKIPYPDPANHRKDAGGGWSDDTYDPWDDLLYHLDAWSDIGVEVDRFITSRKVVSKLVKNEQVRRRIAGFTVLPAGADLQLKRATLGGLNAALAADGMPTIETYEGRYMQAGVSKRFMADNVFLMIGKTGRDATIDLGAPDGQQFLTLQNTAGYVGIGPAEGQTSPGRKVLVKFIEERPTRIQGMAWQASLPVIQDPEHIRVIKNIT